MNRYEVRISNQQPITVRACKASVALARALRKLTDSQFLNTGITIKFLGRVPRVFHVRAYHIRRDSWGETRTLRIVARNFITRKEAETEIDKLRSRPDLFQFHITSSLAEDVQ